MAEKLCQLKKKGGGGSGVDVSSAELKTSSPVTILAGHAAIISTWRTSVTGTVSVSISISGNAGTDYDILFQDTTSVPETGSNLQKYAFKGMVVKAKHDITITLSETSSGTTYSQHGILVYDLS